MLVLEADCHNAVLKLGRIYDSFLPEYLWSCWNIFAYTLHCGLLSFFFSVFMEHLRDFDQGKYC